MKSLNIFEPPGVADRFLDGRLSLVQPQRGYRAGTDALLLAAAAPPHLTSSFIDVGSGVGTAGLAAALRLNETHLTLLDHDPIMADYARYNIRLNELSHRAKVVQLDLLSRTQRQEAGLLDGQTPLVLTNPPFWDPQSVRISPDPRKARAHVMAESETLEAWIKACISLLEPGGWFIMIHRADHLGMILTSCARRLGQISILPIHAHMAQPAIRLIIAGKKGSRAPLRILPNWILHDETGNFTAATEALHRGKDFLSCLWE